MLNQMKDVYDSQQRQAVYHKAVCTGGSARKSPLLYMWKYRSQRTAVSSSQSSKKRHLASESAEDKKKTGVQVKRNSGHVLTEEKKPRTDHLHDDSGKDHSLHVTMPGVETHEIYMHFCIITIWATRRVCCSVCNGGWYCICAHVSHKQAAKDKYRTFLLVATPSLNSIYSVCYYYVLYNFTFWFRYYTPVKDKFIPTHWPQLLPQQFCYTGFYYFPAFKITSITTRRINYWEISRTYFHNGIASFSRIWRGSFTGFQY